MAEKHNTLKSDVLLGIGASFATLVIGLFSAGFADVDWYKVVFVGIFSFVVFRVFHGIVWVFKQD